ncbi:MAG: ferrous iron transport protein A [Halodesulfurarchaeum sp.]
METTLAEVGTGDAFHIDHVENDQLRAKLRRLGFLDGRVECRTRLTRGPVVVSRRGTDLALGASVADGIAITEVESP